MREEGIALEHSVHRTFMRRNVSDVLSVDEDGARICRAESCEDTEQGGLSASGRTEKSKELSTLYGNAYIVEDALVSETLRYMIDFNNVVSVLHHGQIKGSLSGKSAHKVLTRTCKVEFPCHSDVQEMVSEIVG